MLCGIYAGAPETQRTKRDSDDRGESRPDQQDRYFECTSGGTTTKRVHLLADIFDIFGSVHEKAENRRRIPNLFSNGRRHALRLREREKQDVDSEHCSGDHGCFGIAEFIRGRIGARGYVRQAAGFAKW